MSEVTIRIGRKAVIGAAVAVILFAAGYLASPYWSVHQIKAGLNDRDAQAIAPYIDFPALRDNLKGTSGAFLSAQARSAGEDDQLVAGLALVMGPAIINGMIDQHVTPAGLQGMLDADSSASSARDAVESASGSDAMSSNDLPQAVEKGRIEYRSLDQFAIVVDAKDGSQDTASFLLERRGLFGWQLTGIELPPSFFESKTP
ncbi:MAG: DUF2939 domain-containing protein [Alphaproteobacteria bacterium]